MYSNAIERREDPLRIEPRVKIGVECAVRNQVLPGGTLVNQGYNELVVYQSDLPAIEAMVEDRMDEYERAVRVHDEARAHYAGKEIDYRGPQSPAAEFYRVMYRNVLPLRKVTKLGELPPPQAPEEQHQDRMLLKMATMFAEAVAAKGQQDQPQSAKQQHPHRGRD